MFKRWLEMQAGIINCSKTIFYNYKTNQDNTIMKEDTLENLKHNY